MDIKKIYFDMDGVISNFDGGVKKYCNMTIKKLDEQDGDDDNMWLAIEKVDHFYYKLEPYDYAKKMLEDMISIYGDKVEILTAVPKDKRRIYTASEDKINWVKDILQLNLHVNIVKDESKNIYAKGKEYILIDDYNKNIKEWESCGGIGIHFSSESYEEIFDLIKEIEKNN